MIESLKEVLSDSYSRYGLAVACAYSEVSLVQNLNDEEEFKQILLNTLCHCAQNFRMKTEQNPSIDNELHFRAIPLEELEKDKKLVQSCGLADKGYYLFPSTLVNGEGAATSLFKKNVELRAELTSEKVLKNHDIKTFFDLRNKEILNRKSVKKSFYYTCCSLITAMTPYKPCFLNFEKIQGKVNMSNCAVIPDLPLEDMIVFVKLFSNMQASVNLMSTTISHEYREKNKGKFKRPPIFNGNYPNAPNYPKLLGGVGLLASIGLWAKENDMRDKAQSVLESLEDTSLYLITADGTSQEHFKSPIIKLAYSGELESIVRSLSYTARKISDVENEQLLFIFHASRFMQQFNRTYFKNFLSVRTEYQHWLLPLIKEYFMTTENISKELVQSATALGKWLNSICYFAAKDKLGKAFFEEIAKEKNKYIAELESTIMASKSSIDLASRISTRGGRMAHSDMPVEVLPFLQASAWGEIEHKVAQQLVISFMRVRSNITKSEESNKSEAQESIYNQV